MVKFRGKVEVVLNFFIISDNRYITSLKAIMDSSKAPGEWKQFIFFCWESPLSCVIGWCFPCLLSCSNARHLDKQGVVYSCFSCCNTPFANFLLRDEARKKFGIKGSDLEDLVSVLLYLALF